MRVVFVLCLVSFVGPVFGEPGNRSLFGLIRSAIKLTDRSVNTGIEHCYTIYMGLGEAVHWTAYMASSNKVNHISMYLEPAGVCKMKEERLANLPFKIDRSAFIPTFVSEYTDRNQLIMNMIDTSHESVCENVILYHWSGYTLNSDASQIHSLARPHKICTRFRTMEELAREPKLGHKQPIFLGHERKPKTQFPLNLDGFVKLGISPPVALREVDKYIFRSYLSELDDLGVQSGLISLGYASVLKLLPKKSALRRAWFRVEDFVEGVGVVLDKAGDTFLNRLTISDDPTRDPNYKNEKFDGFFNNCSHFARRLVLFLEGTSTSRVAARARLILPNFYYSVERANERKEPEAFVGTLDGEWTQSYPAIAINTLFTDEFTQHRLVDSHDLVKRLPIDHSRALMNAPVVR